MGGRRRETESVLYSTTLHAEQAIEKRVTSSRHCGAAGAVVPDTVEALYHQCKSKATTPTAYGGIWLFESAINKVIIAWLRPAFPFYAVRGPPISLDTRLI